MKIRYGVKKVKKIMSKTYELAVLTKETSLYKIRDKERQSIKQTRRGCHAAARASFYFYMKWKGNGDEERI